jgi:hypothetical protein
MGSRKQFPVTALLGFGLFAGACADDEVAAEYEPVVEIEVNPDVDLSQYATFDIVDPKLNAEGEPPPNFTAIQAELEQAIVDEMRVKGLTRVSGSPQLLINPLINVEPATDAAQFYQSAYGWYWGYEYLWTVQYEYTEGTLVLDVLDVADPELAGDDVLVYRGAVMGLLAEDLDVIELQIRNATAAVLASWPGCTRAPDV